MKLKTFPFVERVAHKTFGREEMFEPPLFNVLSTPIPECPVSVLLDKYKIMETLGRNLDVLVGYARYRNTLSCKDTFTHND
jgi:hypothetical protein